MKTINIEKMNKKGITLRQLTKFKNRKSENSLTITASKHAINAVLELVMTMAAKLNKARNNHFNALCSLNFAYKTLKSKANNAVKDLVWNALPGKNSNRLQEKLVSITVPINPLCTRSSFPSRIPMQRVTKNNTQVRNCCKAVENL